MTFNNRLAWLIPLAWLTLVIGIIPGLIVTTEWNRALLFASNLLSAVSFCFSVLLVLNARPQAINLLLAGLVAGVFLSAADGWYEIKGGGLENTLEYAEENAQVIGQSVDPRLRSRLEQGRASGTFFYPNSYAAHLILTLPLCLAALWRWGRHVHPPGLSRALFIAFAVISGGLPLLWSGSRAALIALGGGLFFAMLFMKQLPKYWRIGLAVMVMVTAFGGLFVVNKGRTLSSLGARFYYWTGAADMTAANPGTGVGIGEFYPEYCQRLGNSPLTIAGLEIERFFPGFMQTLDFSDKLTREPHNFWLLFSSESGLLGALAATILLSMPFWFQRLRKGRNMKNNTGNDRQFFIVAGRAGLAAWLLHGLTDMNMHVPGTVIVAAALPLLALFAADSEAISTASDNPPPKKYVKAGLILLGVLTLFGGWRLPGDLAMRNLGHATASDTLHTSELQSMTMKTARLLPFSPNPWLLLADRAESNGHLKIARRACREALARTPHRGFIWARLAVLEQRLGDTEAAARAMTKADHWGAWQSP
ncbi:MAG: O-antigen ligase family protein [Lentisphaeria bacterium]